MSNERFNIPPGLQGAFSQVLKEVQNALNKLETTVANATQTQGVPLEEEAPATPADKPQAAPTPKPKSNYNGQKWEYKVAYVNFRGQVSSEGEQVMIGRGERRSSFVRSYLDELGAEGWELAGVSPLGETENSYFVFKRPWTGEKPAATTSNGKATVEEVDESGVVNI